MHRFMPVLMPLLIGLAAAAAQADTNLVMVCKDANAVTAQVGKPLNQSSTLRCQRLGWVKPEPSSIAASCLATNCGSWTGSDSAWRVFDTLPSTARIAHCTADIAPNSTWAAGTAGTDPCAAANKPTPWLLKTAVVMSSTTPPPAPAASTGTITLGWEPPTENTDGTPLTNLAGYKLYHSTNPELATVDILTLSNAGLTRYEWVDLPAGQHYFAITAFNTAGVESERSGTANGVIDAVVLPTVALSCSPVDGVEKVTPTCVWSSSNATACTASGGWTGSRSISGTFVAAQITAQTDYTIVCTGPGGSATATARVNVSPRPKGPLNLQLQVTQPTVSP